jgi:hypothetical protein
MSGTEQAETRLATIVRRPNGLVETRFREEALIDEEGMRENIRTRRQLCADQPHALLTVVPPDAEFATAVMSPDLFPSKEDRACIKAIALVTANGVPGMMARLYFSCFPEVATTRVFSEEATALDWLEQHLLASAN